MKPQIVFAYESHSDLTPTLAIEKCIPFLKFYGITGFGIEKAANKPGLCDDSDVVKADTKKR